MWDCWILLGYGGMAISFKLYIYVAVNNFSQVGHAQFTDCFWQCQWRSMHVILSESTALSITLWQSSKCIRCSRLTCHREPNSPKHLWNFFLLILSLFFIMKHAVFSVTQKKKHVVGGIYSNTKEYNFHLIMVAHCLL